MITKADERAVWNALMSVPDPEIPAVSVVDMGMILGVDTSDAEGVTVTVLPTFTGCPAIPVIKADIKKAVEAIDGVDNVRVETTFSPPWTPERITPDGRRKLTEFGLAPPTGDGPVLISQIGLPMVAACPFCGSKKTHLENAFGPTPCRSLYYCDDCRNPFEQFKTV
ncbi:MAG: ring,2-phenylacetyl-CoA epoxidase subunit PaaD [Actinomycetota bacterium]|nr:ring,2-phenylacetyl-CoA epoxidase subunit PaaD [Actinomycetota bacterium]